MDAALIRLIRVLRLYDRPVRPPHSLIAWLYQRELRFLVEALEARPSMTVLDVGCGDGTITRLFTALGAEVHAVDIAPHRVEAVRPFVRHATVGGVEDIDLGAEFDRVLCAGVLDFVAEPERALANLARHLKPGGRLVVLAPRRTPAGWLLFAKHFALRGIRVKLFDELELGATARRIGLIPLGVTRPFPHNVVFAWTKPS